MNPKKKQKNNFIYFLCLFLLFPTYSKAQVNTKQLSTSKTQAISKTNSNKAYSKEQNISSLSKRQRAYNVIVKTPKNVMYNNFIYAPAFPNFIDDNRFIPHVKMIDETPSATKKKLFLAKLKKSSLYNNETSQIEISVQSIPQIIFLFLFTIFFSLYKGYLSTLFHDK